MPPSMISQARMPVRANLEAPTLLAATAAMTLVTAGFLCPSQVFVPNKGGSVMGARLATLAPALFTPTRQFESTPLGNTAAGGAVAVVAGVSAAALALRFSPRRGERRQGAAHAVSISRFVASGPIDTFLVPGKVDAAKLSMACAPLANHIDLSALVFFSLGVPVETIASVAGGALGIHGVCPVYIADCYGIVGFDKAAGKNVELMEKGRGSEYGCQGGNGGEGVVVVAFRGDHKATTLDDGALPSDRSLHMLVTSAGKPSAPPAGAIYGGVAKACHKLEHSGDLVSVPQFAVSTTGAVVTSFDGDAGEAAKVSMSALSKVTVAPTAAGYFPCFCRGVNKYGEDGVEPDAFAANGLTEIPLFGMFAHGELGPPKGAPVVCLAEEPAAVAVEMHSMTSILALYAS